MNLIDNINQIKKETTTMTIFNKATNTATTLCVNKEGGDIYVIPNVHTQR